MKTTIDAPNYRRNDGTSRQELAALYADTCGAVLKAYREIRQLQPVVASSIDPDEAGNRKLTPIGIEFCIDCENATKKALERHPELVDVWMRIVREEPVDVKLESKIAWLCGKVYVARKLHPARYFKVQKFYRNKPEVRMAA